MIRCLSLEKPGNNIFCFSGLEELVFLYKSTCFYFFALRVEFNPFPYFFRCVLAAVRSFCGNHKYALKRARDSANAYGLRARQQNINKQ